VAPVCLLNLPFNCGSARGVSGRGDCPQEPGDP
jgi:hypothetical protein